MLLFLILLLALCSTNSSNAQTTMSGGLTGVEIDSSTAAVRTKPSRLLTLASPNGWHRSFLTNSCEALRHGG
jgi:hypothetical protein